MGDYVRIRGERFTVTGVLRPTGGQDDDLLVAELGDVQRLLGREGELTLIEVAAVYSGAPVDQIVSELSAALPEAEVAAVREAVASRLHAVDQFKGFSLVIAGIVVGIEILVVFLTVMGSVSRAHHRDRRLSGHRFPAGPDHPARADRGRGRRRRGRRARLRRRHGR